MTTTTIFDEFLLKLKVSNAENISLRYGEVTRALNLQFRDNDNRDSNRLQVGSYGRYTAIKGVSDLDMLYIMPASKKNEYYNGGQLQLLKDAKQAIQNRYPSTNIFVDSPVVCVKYTDFDIELQPVFEIENGFEYPDVNSSSWKITKPRQEISAMK
ncbi:MAG: nucleotidyltransferase, partial [Gammaproteobacteria bacterium]|nr:nucleotidyltransferase [Gammaproteobacteria bacterium]